MHFDWRVEAYLPHGKHDFFMQAVDLAGVDFIKLLMSE